MSNRIMSPSARRQIWLARLGASELENLRQVPRAPVTGALSSILGRRFVLMFTMCALLPLIVFATLAVTRVSNQVSADTSRSLHDAAKTAGMGIAARLSQIAGDVSLASELVQDWKSDRPWFGGDALDRQVGNHCDAVWLVVGERVDLLCGEADFTPIPMSQSEQAHLASGKKVVQVVGNSGELYMTVDINPSDDVDARVVALVRREWFWDPEELCGVNCLFAACDRNGRVLYHTFDEPPASHTMGASITRESASGSIEWSIGGDLHIARYWHAFLRPQYAFDLWVVQSRSQQDAFAVNEAFVRWFWLTALGTLLCVVFGSLVRMRRTLAPIMSLRDATQRLGAGDLDVRVSVDSRDELGELGSAFNDMAQRLQVNISQRERTERELVTSRDAALAAAKAKVDFVNNVSHEFRTPMAEILSATEILTQIEDDDDATVREEFSGIALHGARRLARLLDDVLEIGDTTTESLVSVDVRCSLEAAINSLEPELRGRVVSQSPESLPCVRGDHDRLEQAFYRLLDNANKFSAQGTPIEIQVELLGACVVVDVTDHGVGIAKEDLERVFEPFSQVGRDQMLDKAQGTGLGLALVRSTIESHGGSITVRSACGLGTTFRVSLPVDASLLGTS